MPVLTVRRGTAVSQIEVPAKATVLQGLQQGGVFPVEAPCGGNGTCGHCLVEVRGSVSAPGARERSLLPPGEHRRLACLALVEDDCEVILPSAEEHIAKESDEALFVPDGTGTGLGAAVDIGTTTVVLYLYERLSGERLAVAGDRNAQCSFGADVISRIQYTMEQADGLERLRAAITEQLGALLDEACISAGRRRDEVTALFVAGNTVMLHLLVGLSPAGIAVAPFTPQSLFGDFRRATDVIPGLEPGAEMFLAPCISGYVGGDITAGLTSVRSLSAEKPILFVDVGTNGEMAFGGKDGLICCSTAAGPAFEGANLSCGMTATEGAIHKVTVRNGGITCHVLGGGEAKGVCGSGLVDALAALLQLGVVDETGRLLPSEEVPEEYASRMEGEGNGVRFLLADKVWITAADIRKLQLAKAAIAAGIDTLLAEAHVSMDDLSAFYLAGGFGSFLDPESAAAIGLFPAELLPVLRVVGNSAGSGISSALLSMDAREEMMQIARMCSYLELSGMAEFNDRYMDHMMFE